MEMQIRGYALPVNDAIVSTEAASTVFGGRSWLNNYTNCYKEYFWRYLVMYINVSKMSINVHNSVSTGSYSD
jgi:hypothetical protein